MSTMKQTVGTGDKYNHGKVVHIDFTYCDCVIVWVEYKRYCKAYRHIGG